MAPAHHPVAGVFALLFHRCPPRRHHSQGGTGFAHHHFGADLHLLLCDQHVRHENGPRRQYQYGAGHVGFEHDSRTRRRLSHLYGQPRRDALQPRCGSGAFPQILCPARQKTCLPQGSDHQPARLGSRLSARGGRAARSRGLSRQEKIVAATQLFRLVLPTSPRHEGQTPGRQCRYVGRRSQQQHFAADSLRFGRHACALRWRNALAFRETPHQLGAGRPLSPRIGDLDASLALPFPFGTRFAAIT